MLFPALCHLFSPNDIRRAIQTFNPIKVIDEEGFQDEF
jgi:hypothetical protein